MRSRLRSVQNRSRIWSWGDTGFNSRQSSSMQH
jgi:hypothetical protein